MAFSNRELLARLIKCEAGGEGENGMKAVATVIMNRVNSAQGEYARISQDGDIRNIVFQEEQFTCAMEMVRGKYNAQNLYNLQPELVHYEIADWVIAGNKLTEVGDSLWFMNPYSSSCPSKFPYDGEGTFHTRINNHCFFRPTPLYYNS